MRILFLEGDMSRPGGTERMTAWLSGQLAHRHEVHILSLHMNKPKVFYPLDAAVKHSCLPSGKTYQKIREIHRYIRQNSIDAVICVDTGMGWIGIFAARGTTARVITWEHSNFFNNWNSRLFPYLRRFAARHSDAMVVLTARDKRNYEAGICGCAPVTVLPNPAAQDSVLRPCEKPCRRARMGFRRISSRHCTPSSAWLFAIRFAAQ